MSGLAGSAPSGARAAPSRLTGRRVSQPGHLGNRDTADDGPVHVLSGQLFEVGRAEVGSLDPGLDEQVFDALMVGVGLCGAGAGGRHSGYEFVYHVSHIPNHPDLSSRCQVMCGIQDITFDRL
jgi:hypothetical protein